LDTRTKIVDRRDLPEGRYIYVGGTFDPLLAAHARRLRELREPGAGLVAVIREPERPVLRARARAELVAALDCVDYVVIGGEAALNLESEHDAIYRELLEHVARRHGA
jgi:glycerol-3-phosphate cytidylyltransferase-like family protein